MIHHTHKTRYSDSSLYDTKCVYCGETDEDMENLRKPCRMNSENSDSTLTELIFAYGDTAYAEGAEGRHHDTKDRVAEEAYKALLKHVASMCNNMYRVGYQQAMHDKTVKGEFNHDVARIGGVDE